MTDSCDATTLSYFVPALGISGIVDVAPRQSRRVVLISSGTDSTTNHYAEFANHFDKLEAIEKDRSLWPEGADAPSDLAITWALAVLQQLKADNLPPTRVVASAEGGVAICFVSGNKYVDIECLNNGAILGVTSNRRDRPTAWEIEPSVSNLTRASLRIRDFLKGPPTEENASKWPWRRWRFSAAT